MTSRSLGRVFEEEEVARLYNQRAPFPPDTFAILESLLIGPRAVLDLGAGSGALARYMLAFADRIDAIDPSAAMIAEGRRLPHGNDPRIRWVIGTAEDAPLDPPYGLATAGASLHWMDLERVFPRLVPTLVPGARLAILETEESPIGDDSWLREADIITKRYDKPGDHLDIDDVMTDIETTGRFVREAERRTLPISIHRSIHEYLDWQHTKTSLARSRIGERAGRYDADMRALFARRGMSNIELEIVGRVIYGRPVAT
jgi:SAM-dependent methyltransferase